MNPLRGALILAQMSLIFLSSTQAAGLWSAEAFAFYSLLLGLPVKADTMPGLLAKGVHALLFYALGCFLQRGLKARRGALWWTIAVCALTGSASEVLQMFTGRHPSIFDSLLNTASGALAAAMTLRFPGPDIGSRISARDAAALSGT